MAVIQDFLELALVFGAMYGAGKVGFDMKRERKPVTKELIRKHFGKDAKVSSFGGRYRVKTSTGAEVVISAKKMKLIYGGDDAYRAMTLLMGECWGSGKVHGSREFMLAAVAHGEAWGVNIQPNFRNRGATFVRWCAATFVFAIGCMLLPDRGEYLDVLGVFLVCALVFRLMKCVARRDEQRKLETSGFIYPRQVHGAEYADDEQLREGGLI